MRATTTSTSRATSSSRDANGTSRAPNFLKSDAPDEQLFYAKSCEHDSEPGKALCAYLLENSSTEFAAINYGRALRCLGQSAPGLSPTDDDRLPADARSRTVRAQGRNLASSRDSRRRVAAPSGIAARDAPLRSLEFAGPGWDFAEAVWVTRDREPTGAASSLAAAVCTRMQRLALAWSDGSLRVWDFRNP